MPLPKPNADEIKDDFISRCMGDEVMLGEYPDEKQRYAICNSQWPHSATGNTADMMEQLMPVFKTGTHTDSQGNTKDWTGEDLDRIAASYDPAVHEAPIVIGHPKDNAPAFGWVEGLERKGEVLFAKAKQLVPEFVDMIRQGLFKKRSISLYPDGTLRHIGFLGAMPPAVKGLADVAFAGGEEDTVIEFAAPVPAPIEDKNISQNKGGTNMSLKDKIKTRFSKVIDDMPEEDLTTEPAMFSEAEVTARVAEATKKAKEEGIAEGKKVVSSEFAEKQREIKKAEIDNYVKGLIAGDGKKGRALVAAKKAGLVEFMLHLDDAEVIEFADPADAGSPQSGDTEGGRGAGKTIKTSPLAVMKAILETLPQDITYAEHATKDKDVGGGGNKEKREKLILDFQEHNKDATYKEAVLAVSKEKPELFSRTEG